MRAIFLPFYGFIKKKKNIKNSKLRPEDPENYIIKVENKSKLDKIFKFVIEQTFEDPEVIIYCGDVYRYQYRLHEAEEMYKQAIIIDPGNVNYVRNLAGLYFDMEEWQKAEKYYNILINKNPNESDYYISLVFIYFFQERPVDEINLLKQTINLFPNESFFPRTLGDIYFHKKNLEVARDLYSRAIKLVPSLKDDLPQI